MRLAALLLTCTLPWQAQAAEPPLRFIAPLNHAMPFGGFEQDKLTTGIVKDLSDAIAERMGRPAAYLSVPPRRVAQVLAAGEADGVCYVAKDWIDGKFHWGPAMLEHQGVVAARPQAPAINSLQDLAGQPLGTVHAYRYPQFEQALGKRFIRDDAPSMLINLRKLAANRMNYALTEQITLEFHNKLHPGDGLRAALQTIRYRTHCVFTLAHPLPLERLDQAMLSLVRDGSVDRILSRYR